MKVLNFGSLNIDMVYAVDHFVRAGETLSSDRLVRFCGGKGLNAGCIGRDGGMLLDLLAASGADTRFVRQLDEASGHAIIQVDKKGQNCILLYGGANLQITEAFADQVLAACDRGGVLLLQNEINLLPYIVEKAYGRGMEIALNPSPINDQLGKLPLEKIRYFILNEIEGRELTGEEAPEDILREFRRRYPEAVVVLTLGKSGAVYDDGHTRCRHGIYKVPVGCGRHLYRIFPDRRDGGDGTGGGAPHRVGRVLPRGIPPGRCPLHPHDGGSAGSGSRPLLRILQSSFRFV